MGNPMSLSTHLGLGLQRLPQGDAKQLFGSGDAAHAYEYVGVPKVKDLDPGELAVVARATERRVRTFAAGRICAHAALAARGSDRTPLLPDPAGQPDWPADAPGSIAHVDGYAIAAVLADPRLHVGIGVDAEALGAMSREVAQAIFTPAECRRLATLEADAWMAAATLMFCAKEAFYKAQFRLTGAWVDFHDLEVRIEPTGVSLHPASDHEPLAMLRWPLSVGHTVRRDVVVAAVLIPMASLATCGASSFKGRPGRSMGKRSTRPPGEPRLFDPGSYRSRGGCPPTLR